MSARSVVGIVLYALGLIMLVYAGLNFNNLFFVQRLMAKSDIPVYSQMVFIPILAGLLALLDGSFVANLNRRISGMLCILGNLAWAYGFYLLHARLSVPVEDIGAYRIAFYLISAGVLLFIIGAIADEVRKGSK